MQDYPQNEGLEKLEFLIGEWQCSATHPTLPGQVFEAKTKFEWLKPSALMIMRTDFAEKDFPSSVAVFGWDDHFDAYTLLYHDVRGVSRRYEMAFNDNEWKMHRDAEGFMQRFTGKINAERTAISGTWEVSADGVTWEKDAGFMYKKQ